MIIFSQIKHLLPKARAWRLTIEKPLRQFFEGLANGFESSSPLEFGDDIEFGDDVEFEGTFRGPVGFYDDVFLDLFPATTRQIDEWESQFGLFDSGFLTEQQRRDRLSAAWSTTGGQSPRYIQDTLQANGFNVYVHEWWVPGTDTPRDPGEYISDPDFILVNKIEALLPKAVQVGDGSLMGTSVQVGEINVSIVNQAKPIPTDPDTFPFFVYFGDEVYGVNADIPAERKAEFEALCLKLCPTQLWIGLLINYV